MINTCAVSRDQIDPRRHIHLQTSIVYINFTKHFIQLVNNMYRIHPQKNCSSETNERFAIQSKTYSLIVYKKGQSGLSKNSAEIMHLLGENLKLIENNKIRRRL